MTIYNLTFGVELECYLPAGLSREQCARAITERLDGAGTCQVDPYSHRPTAYWKLTTNGSLGDYSHGIEIVSPALPPLQGQAGLNSLGRVCEALTDLGCTVNRAAGFHVHVGARNQPMRFWKNIARFYQAYEPVIDGFMPASRRASNNPYCRTLATTSPAAIEAATTIHDLANEFWRATRAGDGRYHKLNVTAHARHGTVEFRQHSGTIDARKTRNWVLTCLRMVHACKGNLAFGSTAASTAVNRARPGSKAYQIGQMLLRPEGTTGPEVCQAMGWPRVSMPAQARAAGLEVYSQRTGRVVRYFVRRDQPATTNTTLDISLHGFCMMIESSDNEREYLEARTHNLRGATPWAA